MQLPKFLLADNSDFPEEVYIVHTDFPRFVLNIENDAVEWFEELDNHDIKELQTEMENLIVQAFEFYDREINRLES